MRSKNIKNLITISLSFLLLSGCSKLSIEPMRPTTIAENSSQVNSKVIITQIVANDNPSTNSNGDSSKIKKEIIDEFKNESNVLPLKRVQENVITHIKTNSKEIALTFDANDGEFDENVYSYLKNNNIKATLFVTSNFIKINKEIINRIKEDGIVQIQNHGLTCKPLSVNGQEFKGEVGTKDVSEVYDEIMVTANDIKKITGGTPMYFRSGCGVYDNVSANIALKLKVTPVSYYIDGDALGKLDSQKAKAKVSLTKNGSIVKYVIDNKNGTTLDCLKEMVSQYNNLGFTFSYLK